MSAPPPPKAEEALSEPSQYPQPSPALQATLAAFWARQGHELVSLRDFKTHALPLARIKKIMKSDEDVRMISSEAPALFAKACELFILEARPARSIAARSRLAPRSRTVHVQ
jgi:nuclear transcription factor Y gamma